MSYEAARLAEELRGALDDPDLRERDLYPWEHLGDAERDVRVLLAELARVSLERDRAIAALALHYEGDES